MMEVEDQACMPRLGGMAFPHASDTITGKFSNDGVDEIVWNIKGELVPGHEQSRMGTGAVIRGRSPKLPN